MVVIGGLFIYALLVELGLLATDTQDIHLINSEKALTLFVLLCGLSISLEQHSQSVRPYIVYGRDRGYKSQLGLPDSPNGYWRVILRNSGRGIAIFMNATCELDSQKMPIEKLYVYLDKLGLKQRKDYVLKNISCGSALQPGGEVVIAEIAWDKLNQWPDMYLNIEIESVTDVRYARKINVSAPEY